MVDAGKMFGLSGWLLKALPSTADRDLLSARLFKKLTGVRRGRLNLPHHFPQEVKALSDLTIGQLRETVYWIKSSDSTRYFVSREVASSIHQAVPGGYMWTVNGDLSVHERQRQLVKPLPISAWPRLGTRPAWPSSPSVVELIAMSRRGITAFPLAKPVPDKHPVSLALYNTNAVLRAQIVSKQIVGIRSTVEVPDKYLGYFHYRWNFLILTNRYDLPYGLVRFLTGQWKRNPHNLWLRRKISFKSYLKELDFTSFRCVHPGPW